MSSYLEGLTLILGSLPFVVATGLQVVALVQALEYLTGKELVRDTARKNVIATFDTPTIPLNRDDGVGPTVLSSAVAVVGGFVVYLAGAAVIISFGFFDALLFAGEFPITEYIGAIALLGVFATIAIQQYTVTLISDLGTCPSW